MTLPKFHNSSKNERLGVLEVGLIFTELGFIFRETSNTDTGIDGFIEEVNEKKEATGRILALQIKSGESYFHDHGDHFVFYTDESHIKYWKLYPLPVMLCIHNPKTQETFFKHIKSHSQNLSNKIIIPKNQILSKDNKECILEILGGYSSQYHSIPELYELMKNNKISVGKSYVSFMDLFIGGLTNLCYDLYCDTSVLSNLLDIRGKQKWIHIGQKEHEFFWHFLKFITIENLVRINFDACLFNWVENSMDPQILASLTFRGREYINFVEQQHPGTVCESYVSLHMDHYWDNRMENLEIKD